MSDLHSRIAAVATNHQIDLEGADWWECSCGHRFSIHDDNYLTWDEHMADAVIAELGLRVEYGMSAQHDYSDKPEIHPVTKDEMEYRTWYGEDFTFRYVTDWNTDWEADQ